MERRYVGISTVGNPASILEKVRIVVQSHDAAYRVPIVKFEKNARGQFYVFLAVDGSGDIDLPEDVNVVLQGSGLTGPRFWPLRPDEIKKMTSGDIEIHGMNSLVYRASWSNDFGDPFDIGTHSDIPDTTDLRLSQILQESQNRFLYWLSANAEGTWQSFVTGCRILQVAGDATDARSLLRRLVLLGHIDSSEDGLRWSISPGAIVSYATDSTRAFLAGQRTPTLLKNLDNTWAVQSCSQENFQGPSRVEIVLNQTMPEGNLSADLGSSLLYVGSASRKLVELLPDLEGWKNLLPNVDRLSTARLEVQIWNGAYFVPCESFYERDGRYHGPSGMYQLTTQARTSDQYRMTLYLDEPNQRWLKGDWYGLRFLSIASSGIDKEAVYVSDTNEFLVPTAQRWPLLYERALVLASGLLPTRPNNPEWLRYQQVPIDIVLTLCQKLSIKLREVTNA